MNRFFVIVMICFAFSQEKSEKIYSDGPYVFIGNKKLIEKQIIDGNVVERELEPKAYPVQFIDEKPYYKSDQPIIVISDIHGQPEVLQKLLYANQIVNENGNWDFGKGILVITGDIFDRGPKVTEVLWNIFELEKQAKSAGGYVHLTLGNHEHMILYDDERYIHEKYMKTAKLLGLKHKDLFGENTVLGRWLRSKTTIMQINDILFVHGGISRKFLNGRGIDFEKINDAYHESIGMTKAELRASKYKDLYDTYSPIWFRGYFKDTLDTDHIDGLLATMNVKHIVVGHTTMETISRFYDGKIYMVDAGMKYGKRGELLRIENGKFYRFDDEGQQLEFIQQ